jgi:hypothetical protein
LNPLGGRVAAPIWKAYGSDAFADWLADCHLDPNVFMRVYAHFVNIVDKIELSGPHADAKWVKKLEGYGGLGEARYNDGTGAYRMFFKFGRLGLEPVAVFADGDRKNSDDFPPERYEKALRLVDACLESEGVDEAKDW